MTAPLILLLTLAAAASNADPLDTALARYRTVASYRVTLHSHSTDSAETIEYFYKRPGFVRMEFIKPHKGAVLVYNPVRKEAKLKPFGFIKPLVLTLDPDNPLIISSRGHRVDASDIGKLLETAKELRNKGKISAKEFAGAEGQNWVIVDIEGDAGVTVAGSVHRCVFWLDAQTYLPSRTITYDERGALVEDVTLDNLVLDVSLSDSFFEL